VGSSAFAATNVDDLFLLVLWFSHHRQRSDHVVFGQFVGLGLLTAAGLLGRVVALALPGRFVGLLGLVPLALGVRAMRQTIRRTDSSTQEEAKLLVAEGRFHRYGPVVSVAAITVANGADNLATYIPLFGGVRLWQAVVMVMVFTVLTGVWCVLAWAITRAPLIGVWVRDAASILLPVVMIGLGVYILLRSGSFALVSLSA
jgi:cadmium resistance protein CadD (predicted permease)